jgi:hypothetical protein
MIVKEEIGYFYLCFVLDPYLKVLDKVMILFILSILVSNFSSINSGLNSGILTKCTDYSKYLESLFKTLVKF